MTVVPTIQDFIEKYLKSKVIPNQTLLKKREKNLEGSSLMTSLSMIGCVQKLEKIINGYLINQWTTMWLVASKKPTPLPFIIYPILIYTIWCIDTIDNGYVS